MACVPWILFFFCVFDQKKQIWGTEIDYNWFVSPTICFFYQKHKKKQNPGDTSHKKNQISLFEKKKSSKLFACVFKFWSKKSQSTSINCKKNKADIGSFIKFASKLVSIVFLFFLFSCFGYICFWNFPFFYYLI